MRERRLVKEKVSQVYSLIRQAGEERGERTERRFLEVLEKGIADGKCPDWLIGCRKSSSDEDREGIDFWIEINDKNKDKELMPIQVKSSVNSAIDFVERGQSIPAVAINYFASDEEILAKTLWVIERERERRKRIQSPS